VIVALVSWRMARAWRARAHERGDPATPGTESEDARRLAAGGEEEDVSLESLTVGDRLRVRPGRKDPGRRPHRQRSIERR